MGVVYSLNCFQFVAGCHCYLQIFLTFGNTENFVVIFTEEADGRLSWTSELLQEGVQRSAGWAQISLETQEFVHAIRVTSATVQTDQ